ncbi:MAG: NAD-dependent epimerase/dehydratase family protein, partial [Caldilineaceae bacterium]|nr:NAD-dependent epimerase/dehydratase family protein [Caldilineaceae bacterium]
NSADLPSPLPEDGPLDLSNLYAITKFSAEQLTTRYSAQWGKMMTSVRLASVYGPMERPSGSRPRASLIHCLWMAWADGKPIHVAGPSIRRDWIHSADVARAVWMLLTAPAWRHSVYNLSSGIATTFAELVDHFTVHGLQAQWVDDPAVADIAMRPSQRRVPLDMRRLREEIGFAPSIDLAAGIDSILSAQV